MDSLHLGKAVNTRFDVIIMKKSKTYLLVAVAVLAIAGIFAFTMSGKQTPPSPMAEKAAPAEEAATAPAAETAEAPAETAALTSSRPASTLSYDNASLPADPLGERTLGDPLAPVRIEEFSSLTCPHCSHFHKEIILCFPDVYCWHTGTCVGII